jgi:hypothetical protein
MRKNVGKIAAFVALFAFLFLLAPGLSNAKPGKFDIRLLVKKPAIWIASFWNMITPIFDGGQDNSRAVVPSDSSFKIKPLTDSISVKPSKGD